MNIKTCITTLFKNGLNHPFGFIFIIGVMIFLITTANLSGSEISKGKTIFENKCLQCHHSGGEASVIAPSMNATKQWKRFFKKEKHNRKYKKIDSIFTSNELDYVLSYLIEHAADSPKPQAFGLK